MTLFHLDWHITTHLFGSFFLAKFVQYLLGRNLYTKINLQDKVLSAVLAFLMGCCWEVLDEMYQGVWIFDPRGGDWGDIIADLIGCVLAVWL